MRCRPRCVDARTGTLSDGAGQLRERGGAALVGQHPDLEFEYRCRYARGRDRDNHQTANSMPQRNSATRGLKADPTVRVIIQGHAFMQNLRRAHYELGVDARSRELRVAAAFHELVHAI